MRSSFAIVVAVSAVLSLSAGPLAGAKAQGTPELFRQPDISATHIVFSYGGDLWLAPRAGGEARRLTASPSIKRFPKFSPDGKWIAFTGNYGGSDSVYIIPAVGGEPKRLTWRPEPASVEGWTPDSKSVLFRSTATSVSFRYSKLFTVAIDGGLYKELPLPEGDLASFSPDGTEIAYNRIGREFATWKRYRGGLQAYVSLYDFRHNKYSELPHADATDFYPMWHGSRIYFASDRSLTVNLFDYDMRTHVTRQLTHFTDYDLKWPSIGPDAIVFEHAGHIQLFDLRTEQVRTVPVEAHSDMVAARPYLRNVTDEIQSFGISPSGARAVFEARGDVFTAPAKHGDCRDVTNTPGTRELNPSWSPDGKYVAYLSDKSGEYEVYMRPQDGSGSESRLTFDGHVYRYGPVWSPDSKALVYTDAAMRLWMVTVADHKPILVDASAIGQVSLGAWSADSKWIAYTKPDPSHLDAIYVYSVEHSVPHRVSTGEFNDHDPVFDKNGKYLYFLSDRTFSPSITGPEINIAFQNTTRIYVLTLQSGEASPFAPRSDEEKPEEASSKTADQQPAGPSKPAKTGGATGQSTKPATGTTPPKPIVIDFDRLSSRIVAMPVSAGEYADLAAGSEKLFYLTAKVLHMYDVKDREDKTIISGIDAYRLNPACTKLLYKAGNQYGIVDANPGQTVGSGKLDLDLEMRVDPRAEWRQVYWEAWRLERDFYYNPAMHGLNWTAIGERYAKLLPGVASRDDLTYIIGELAGELDTSHAYVVGAANPPVKHVGVGLLGVDFEPAGAYYRFRKIYSGANWDTSTRSPLTEPGIKVKQGDYLIAVNGTALHTNIDPYSLFEDTAGKLVTLRVNERPSDTGAHDVQVRPIGSETALRNLDWIEANRKKVDTATNGRVGYMYVPDTSTGGITAFGEQFYSQTDKDALIVDERYNSGGFIPDFFVQKLDRKLLSIATPRYGEDFRSPGAAIYGPKVILENEWSGSGGDAFPYFFRKAGAGPIIGKRTWGGLVGINGFRRLVDGGGITVPQFGLWSPQDGKWIAENHGIDPSIEVANTPDLTNAGHDPQLERAISYIEDQLKLHPPPHYQHPPFTTDSSVTARRGGSGR